MAMFSESASSIVDELLQIVVSNLAGSVILKKDVEQYFIKKEGELVTKCSQLESEIRKLKSENSQLKLKLIHYESMPVLSRTAGGQQLLEELNQEITTTINDLFVQINTNRTMRDTELSKYTNEYEQCKKQLQKLNLKVSNDFFEKKLREYKKTCETNDCNRKEMFKQLYDIDKLSKDKLAQETTETTTHVNEAQLFVKEQKDKLDKLKELFLTYESNQEKKLYEEALRIGMEESCTYSSLLRNGSKKEEEHKVLNINISGGTIPKIQQNLQEAVEENTSLLNKYTAEKKEQKVFSTNLHGKADSEIQQSLDERSITVVNLPNSHDLSAVVDFLNSMNNALSLAQEDIEITKSFKGRTYKNLTKITLPSVDLMNLIMNGEKTRKVDFNGNTISVLCMY